jgi:hypothetical protein
MECNDSVSTMSGSDTDSKEQHDDVIASDVEKTEIRKGTIDRHEDSEKNDSASVSSRDSSFHEGENEDHDLEAIATVSTNSPPYSVFTTKQKYFIVCRSSHVLISTYFDINRDQSLLHGVASSPLSVPTFTSRL